MMTQIFHITLLFCAFATVGSAQAIQVKDINPGGSSSDPVNMRLSNNGTLYFFATDGVAGAELWKSDGTEAGTVLVKDIFAGPSSSTVYWEHATLFNDFYCFYADDGINGSELWKSDGSTNGTGLVIDIFPGSVGSTLINPFIQFNNLLYFPAYDNAGPSVGFKFFGSDATFAGTTLIKEAFALNGSSIIFNGFLYFGAYGDYSEGYELWKSDGTPTGTTLLKDIYPGVSHGSPEKFTLFNNQLFFIAESSSAVGRELWKSDGTDVGTVLVKDIYPGPGQSELEASNFTLLGGFLYFFADDAVHGRELWKSDGTTAGTAMVIDINPGPDASVCCFLQVLNDKLYFVADDGVHGQEVFVSDGTAGGTVLLKDIRSGNIGSYPYFSVVFADKMFFNADDQVHGQELWSTDGTSANTLMVQDIYPSEGSSFPRYFVGNSTDLYFVADTDDGAELWKYTPVPLPIVLTDFSAKVQGRIIQLLWQTSAEQNNQGFDLERSSNLTEWTNIGHVAAKNAASSYGYQDAAPMEGTNYYRLKQIDLNQQFEYSKVVSASLGTAELLVAQVGRTLQITNIQPNENLQIYLSDLSGRMLFQKSVSASAGGICMVQLEELPQGLYLCAVQHAQEMKTLKIMMH